MVTLKGARQPLAVGHKLVGVPLAQQMPSRHCGVGVAGQSRLDAHDVIEE